MNNYKWDFRRFDSHSAGWLYFNYFHIIWWTKESVGFLLLFLQQFTTLYKTIGALTCVKTQVIVICHLNPDILYRSVTDSTRLVFPIYLGDF